MYSLIRFLLNLCICICIILVCVGFGGKFHPAFDLLAHFRLHLSVGLIATSLILILFQLKRTAFIAVLVGLFGFWQSLSGTLVGKFEASVILNKNVYTLFHFNLLFHNELSEVVIDRIRDLDPEIITVAEQSLAWRQKFNSLEDRWPYKFQCRPGKSSATAIYSKWPMLEETQVCGTYGSVARVDAVAPNGAIVSLVATHFRWPWPASGPKQLTEMLPEIKKFGANAIVAGDFNATTWSNEIIKFANAGDLKIVTGIGPTWMLRAPIIRDWFWAGLPIDNVMFKGKVNVTSAKTLEYLGSDHLPVFVEFQVLD